MNYICMYWSIAYEIQIEKREFYFVHKQLLYQFKCIRNKCIANYRIEKERLFQNKSSAKTSALPKFTGTQPDKNQSAPLSLDNGGPAEHTTVITKERHLGRKCK